MAMYAGAAFPMDASGLRNLDDKHMRAFHEMASWYRAHGEGDPDFVDVCKAIKAKRRAYAQRIKAQLDEVRATCPDSLSGRVRNRPSNSYEALRVLAQRAVQCITR